jgi:hypothetical protein
MAYVLGYWFADGNMFFQEGSGRYFVSIASKDVTHLQAIWSLIGAGSLRQKTRSDVYELVICRKEVYDDLRQLGGTERKSLTLTWPHMPRSFLGDFVRGYIDGDGSLDWKATQPRISAFGAGNFLIGMANAIAMEIGIPTPTRHPHGTLGRISRVFWYGMRAKCLAIWLYGQHDGLSMPRKMQLAAEFAVWQPKVFDPSHITPKMRELFGQYLP